MVGKGVGGEGGRKWGDLNIVCVVYLTMHFQ